MVVVTEAGRRKMALTRSVVVVTEGGRRKIVLTRSVVVVTEEGKRNIVLTRNVVVGTEGGRRKMGLTRSVVVITEGGSVGGGGERFLIRSRGLHLFFTVFLFAAVCTNMRLLKRRNVVDYFFIILG